MAAAGAGDLPSETTPTALTYRIIEIKDFQAVYEQQKAIGGLPGAHPALDCPPVAARQPHSAAAGATTHRARALQ